MALQATDIVEDMAITDRFDGFSIREDGGAATVLVQFYEDTTGGQLLMSIELAADEERTEIFDERVVGPANSGVVHIQTTGTGTLEGVLYSRVKVS